MTPINIISFLILIPLMLFPQQGAAELSLKNFFTPSEITEVQKGRIITDVYLKNSKRISTENSYSQNITIPVTEFTPESLNRNSMITVEKLFLPYDLGKRPLSDLYLTILDPSNLKDMKYYSHRREKLETFILQSRKLADDTQDAGEINKILPHREGMFKIVDNKFGELIFISDLYSRDNDFILVNTCPEPITKFMLELTDKNQYRLISFFFYDKKARGYFCFFLHTLKVKNEFLLNTGLIKSKSFGNRIRACSIHLASLLGIDLKNQIAAFK